jgi:RNA polymerase sigma factor (TIGR02999 family)
MPTPNSLPLTELLALARDGDAVAASEVLNLAYVELRKNAKRLVARERIGHTLQPTALVHEAWIKLQGTGGQLKVPDGNRRVFFAIAANAMRQVLVDHARRRDAARRGSGRAKVSIDDRDATDSPLPLADKIDVDEALKELHSRNPRWAKVFVMRCFGGYKNREVASKLGISVETVKNDWRRAKVWLEKKLASYAP